MEKYTPGPWSNDWVIRGASHIDGHRANGEPIPSLRRVVCHIIDRDDEANANAQLIAAAPELLEAIQRMVAEYEEMGCNCEDVHNSECALGMARAAIAKATGGGK